MNLTQKEIRRFCLEADIDLVFSRPYQKDKTHRVERSHKTVQEMVVETIELWHDKIFRSPTPTYCNLQL